MINTSLVGSQIYYVARVMASEQYHVLGEMSGLLRIERAQTGEQILSEIIDRVKDQYKSSSKNDSPVCVYITTLIQFDC